ncbi:MAG: hypothetical protein E6J17_07505 [Chloroflexi bacterium]|jgi:hypothetical protein|nr:MAG: hypothetical protein E6J17_07505 [Chloroflexota bacterium]
MTTSPETDWMNHPVLRALIDQAATLALEERVTLVKGLIPGIVDALTEEEYEQFVTFIRLKGERYLEAKAHPGEGRAERQVPGERDLEGR